MSTMPGRNVNRKTLLPTVFATRVSLLPFELYMTAVNFPGRVLQRTEAWRQRRYSIVQVCC